MKEIKAIIQANKLEAVLGALCDIDGVPEVTVSETTAIGLGGGQRVSAAKVKIELMVPAELAEAVVETIAEHARTGQAGDGRIFVIPVQAAMDIRTGRHTHGDL